MKTKAMLLTLLLLIGLATLAYAQNGCRYFDGKSVEYTVEIGDMTNHIQHTFTFEAWFKTETLSTNSSSLEGDANGQIMSLQRGRTIIASSDGTNNWAAWLSLYGNTLKFYAFMNHANNNNHYFEYTIEELTENTMDQWYHVAVSASRPGDDRDGMMRMYVNGKPVPNQNNLGGTGNDEYTKPSGNVSNWLTKMFLGDLRIDRRYHFKGWLDDVRIWNEIRTNEQIKNNYNIPIHSPNSAENGGLIGYWKFDDGTVKNSTNKKGVGNVSLDGDVGETEDGYSPEGNPTLPVELSNFYINVTSHNFARLTWVTQSETGVLGFKVYRSEDESLENALEVSPLIEATNTSNQQIYVYTDETVQPGTWYYWLQNIDLDGSFEFHGPILAEISAGSGYSPGIPHLTRIQNVYPNPFNPSSTIRYQLADKSEVNFRIYNTRGQVMETLAPGLKDAGSHELVWDASRLPSGIYIIQMQAGNQIYQSKAVLSK